MQLALTDAGGSYDYGVDVVFEINDSQLSDYRSAAEFVNASDVDVVCVQHEFGIFGGPVGRHVDELLQHVKAPIVTTLHTVLADPSPAIREATRRLAARSDRLVVLADRALELLETAYGIGGGLVTVIPHGVPDPPTIGLDAAKAAIGWPGRKVLLTFGLLGPDKGIEVVIDALPAVVAAHPDLVYLVLGATHPHVQRSAGEAYRESLQQRVRELGLADHVVFVDRYVSLEELRGHLAATDLYITPYHGADQIVSGTLAYAVGMGRAVISTPYRYAVELLADGRGHLVPFGDPAAMGTAMSRLLGDDEQRHELQRRALEHGRRMSWSAVAGAYDEVFADAIAGHERKPTAWAPVPIPAPTFSALRSMTDDTGLFQHAPHGVPDRAHGYCTDDVGRALVASIHGASAGDPVAAGLVPTYLSFLRSAQMADGRFANLLAYDRRFVPGTESEDTLGQAVWGLGAVMGASPDDGWRALATEIFERALPSLGELTDTKAVAYAITGLDGYLERFPGASAARSTMRQLATVLTSRLEDRRSLDWVWFDEELTYANAKVPEALLLAGRAFEEESWVAQGLATLDFLLAATQTDEYFDFVGNELWQRRGGPRAVYGQQPIEASFTARACVVAYEITGDLRYLESARAAIEWLLGRNRLGVALYRSDTGRCADGLDRHGASDNAGGESVVCALLALLALPIETWQIPVDHGPRSALRG